LKAKIVLLQTDF